MVRKAKRDEVEPSEPIGGEERREDYEDRPELVVGLGSNYKGTDKTAQELADAYGLLPDGTPRTEAAPDGPYCPPLAPGDGPFTTEGIPPGCNAPLSQECVDWANEKYGYEIVTPVEETPE